MFQFVVGALGCWQNGGHCASFVAPLDSDWIGTERKREREEVVVEYVSCKLSIKWVH